MNTVTNIENVKSGQYFTIGMVEYQMLRPSGKVEMANVNQWGRGTGGTHVTDKWAVKVNKRRFGWRFSYLATPATTMVTIQSDKD